MILAVLQSYVVCRDIYNDEKEEMQEDKKRQPCEHYRYSFVTSKKKE